MIPTFIHLRLHSAYSLAEGAIKIKEIPSLCHSHKMPAVAITDTANLFGALEFSITCADAGIQPIIGCQINVISQTAKDQSDQLLLLVQTEIGYRNLLKLVSRSYLNQKKSFPEISLEDLKIHNEGLLVLTGGHYGTIGKLLFSNQIDAAKDFLNQLIQIFPDRLYIELMRQGLGIQKQIESQLVDLAHSYNVPLVATNDVFFSTQDMYEAHDALLCIAEGSYVSQDTRRRLTDQNYFKSSEEMAKLFADIPEAILNTITIARRCSFMPTAQQPMLPPYPTLSGKSEAEELVEQAHKGLEKRFEKEVFLEDEDESSRTQKRETYLNRLIYELEIIKKMGFPGYFLIVADFIQWAKNQGIPVGPGRGSGAGSLVAWVLTITDIDPIRFNLIFERFLNPERVSMPDFDIDFCQDRRDEVIIYVREKYGSERVAHIITFGKLQARAVLRDVGRVLQMPYGQVDKICKLIPNNPANPVTLAEALVAEPLLKEAQDNDLTVSKLISIGMKLEGLYRHASTHAAGVVIGGSNLEDTVPLYKDDRSELPATQFHMKYVEMAGLLKFDFLGLKTLTVIERCCQLVRKRGIPFEISQIPLDDSLTFALLCRVETVGIFQVESSGMRDVLRRLKPDRFEDLIALVALYRPGPMDDIPRYLACKHGEEKVTYLHPALQPILEPTYGVMVYQEQVMQIAQVLAGYTLGSADLLRRAMGKKIKAEMDAQRTQFIDGATKNGVDQKTAHLIFDQMAKFAGYGFNKSHAAPYALLTYQTAYLKAHYPLDFFAATMTLDMHNVDKLNVYRQDLQNLNISVLSPDINFSSPEFIVENEGIRYALAAIKNVGAQAMEELTNERQKNGLFKDLTDFIKRLDHRVINKRQLENLVAAGAFDQIHPNRCQIFTEIDTLLRHAHLANTERQSRQNLLFGKAQEQATLINLPDTEDWSPLERLQKEFDALGFFLTAHPLDAYVGSLGKLNITTSDNIQDSSEGATLNLAGIILNKQERMSKTGQKFAFIQISDANGVFEIATFSEVYARVRETLTPGSPYFIKATVRFDGENPRLIAQEVLDLDQYLQSKISQIRLVVDESFQVKKLQNALQNSANGSTNIMLEVHLKQLPPVLIHLKNLYTINADSRFRLMKIPGVLKIVDLAS